MTAFRARTAATQSASSGGTEVVFGTELFDPDDAFASNRFTVPAAWDGKRGQLFTGIRLNSLVSQWPIQIQRSTDGGSTFPFFSAIAQCDTASQMQTLGSVPLTFNSGDVYRVVAFVNATIADSGACFFSGCVFPEELSRTYGVRLTKSSNQNVTSSAFDQVTFDGTLFDPDSLFDNVNDYIEIPAGYTTSFGIMQGQVELDGRDDMAIYVQQSKDSGTTWGDHQGQSYNGDSINEQCFGGVVQVESGDLFRFMVFNATGSTSAVEGVTDTNLSLVTWREELPSAPYAHYDLSVGDYTVSTTDITVIPDRTPNGRDLDTSLSSVWPQTGRSQNSLDVADFVAAGDFIYGDDFPMFANTDQPYTVAMLLVVDAPTTTANIAGAFTLAGDEYYAFVIRDNSGWNWGSTKRDTGGVSAFTNSGDLPTSGVHTVIYTSSGTNQNLWVDGVKVMDNATLDEGAMTGVNLFGLGNILFNGANASGFDGAFGEVFVYDRELSGGDVQVIHNYLDNKWVP